MRWFLHRAHILQFHARAVVSGLIHDPFVAGNLLSSLLRLDPYALLPARALLSATPSPTAFMWNTLISAHISAGIPAAAAALFIQMLRRSTPPNHHTFPPVLKCLSQLRALNAGLSLHAFILKIGLFSDGFVQTTMVHFYGANGLVEAARRAFDLILEPGVSAWTALVSAYAKSEEVDTARQLFNEMPDRNIVSWSAMISGYVQAGRYMEALVLFREMLAMKLRPSSSALVSVLVVLTELGALQEGKWVHAYIERSGVDWSPNLRTSLVHMYVKCGDVRGARQVFDGMGERTVDVWNVMITGLGLHGGGKEAIELFDRMVSEGLKPDDMTFIGVLCGCSHAGLVSEGMEFFDSMSRVHGIPPKVEHYSCMVDLFGRAGHFEEALKVIRTMPMEPNKRVWGSLFGACRIHGNVELGDVLGKYLIELEPNKPGHYVVLANLYVSTRRWKDAVCVRETMKRRGVELEPGCSLIEVDGVVEEFLVGATAHPRSQDIYDMLDDIAKMLSSRGYVPSKKSAWFDVGD